MPKTLAQEALTSSETFASVILTLFIDAFGTEALVWEPATITLELEDEFKIDLPQLTLDKLLVAINILTTDRFFKQLPDFIAFCNVLSGDEYDPRTFDPADAEEVAWGLTEGLLIAPPEEEEPFTHEIRAYIRAALDREGIINPPDILRLALERASIASNIEDFSDDPEMFSAVYALEQGKTEDINRSIKLKTQLLIAQFRALKLDNGKTEELVSILEQAARS